MKEEKEKRKRSRGMKKGENIREKEAFVKMCTQKKKKSHFIQFNIASKAVL